MWKIGSGGNCLVENCCGYIVGEKVFGENVRWKTLMENLWWEFSKI